MKELFNRHPIGVTLVAGALVALIVFYGPSACHKVGDKFWHKGTDKAERSIAADEAEAAKWKAVAQEALGRLEETKRALAEETAKREAAEKILNDQRKVTDAARTAYERALAAPAPSVDYGSSADDLCARARKLGVSCE